MDDNDQISQDSSVKSALINAQNLGLDGEVIMNARREVNDCSMIHLYQMRKIRKPLLKKSPDEEEDETQSSGNNLMQKMNDITSLIFVVIDKKSFMQLELNLLLHYRVKTYFKTREMIEDEIKVKIAEKVKEKLGIVMPASAQPAASTGPAKGIPSTANVFGAMFQEMFARRKAVPEEASPSPTRSPGKKKKKAGKL